MLASAVGFVMNRGLLPARTSRVVCFVKGGQKVSVKFTIPKKVSFGQSVALVGSKSGLGSWDPKQRLSLSWHDGHRWTVEAELPVGEQVEYKYVIVNDADVLEWQPGNNLVLKVPDTSTEVVVIDDWNGKHANVQVLKPGEEPLDPLVDDLRDELVHPFSTAELSTDFIELNDSNGSHMASTLELKHVGKVDPPAAWSCGESESEGDSLTTSLSGSSGDEQPDAVATAGEALETLTVKSLKQVAKDIGVPTSGRKVELIARIRAAMARSQDTLV